MIDNKVISLLFDNNNKEDINKMKINLNEIQLGMTPFQIKHFVLNRKEFPTEFTQFQQTKMELYNRIQTFNDLYYQYRTAGARIKLSEATIDDLKLNRNISSKMLEAKIELQEIEIEKNELKMLNIKKEATRKLIETLVFYEVYKKYENFETKSKKEIEKLDEESWKIKSAYYPKLMERYGLTPEGFLQLPHESGGLQKLIEIAKNNNHGELCLKNI